MAFVKFEADRQGVTVATIVDHMGIVIKDTGETEQLETMVRDIARSLTEDDELGPLIESCEVSRMEKPFV